MSLCLSASLSKLASRQEPPATSPLSRTPPLAAAVAPGMLNELEECLGRVGGGTGLARPSSPPPDVYWYEVKLEGEPPPALPFTPLPFMAASTTGTGVSGPIRPAPAARMSQSPVCVCGSPPVPLRRGGPALGACESTCFRPKIPSMYGDVTLFVLIDVPKFITLSLFFMPIRASFALYWNLHISHRFYINNRVWQISRQTHFRINL